MSFKRSTEISLPYHGQIINIWDEYPLKEINIIVKQTKSRPSSFPIFGPLCCWLYVSSFRRVLSSAAGIDDVGERKRKGARLSFLISDRDVHDLCPTFHFRRPEVFRCRGQAALYHPWEGQDWQGRFIRRS